MAPSGTAALLDQLAGRSAGGSARIGSDADAIDGVRPRLVASPLTGAGVAETLAWAVGEGLAVHVAGGGTKQQWGAPPAVIDLLLTTRRLGRVLEHRHGDLTATVEAGATLASVNMELAAHGQRLPWDPPWPERATIGGIVATNDSGPHRHGHGAPRAAIIGVSVARVDGQIAKAGGIVVKNVAGYDLSRLLTGSFGCLGVILTATFKLAPAPSDSRTVEVMSGSLEQAGSIAAALADAPLTPAAIELTGAFLPRLLIRFESVEASVVQQADEACGIAGAEGCAATVLSGAAEAAAWRAHAAHWEGSTTLVKLTTVPAELFPTIARVRAEAAGVGVEVSVAGRAVLGVADLKLEGTEAAQASLIAHVREQLPPGRGAAVIRRAAASLRREVDPWGPIGDSFTVMQAIKHQFDPAGLLNSRRGPGNL